jgi:hypothetical protein
VFAVETGEDSINVSLVTVAVETSFVVRILCAHGPVFTAAAVRTGLDGAVAGRHDFVCVCVFLLPWWLAVMLRLTQ